MILDELVLHNFGVYRGRQSFKLTPEPEKPIVLVGAQNGAGKTTFLEGLQLAFFGRLASGGFRGAASYEDYLRQSIHRGVPAHEGSEVQVTFRRAAGGAEQLYTVRRAWAVHNGRVREVFEAVCDGRLDRVLTAHWSEFVEEMLPPRIAPLFFFDGERIEQFADLQRSSEIIRTALSALLGLDIVERLQLDLEVLERRKTAAGADTAGRADLAAAEAEADAAEGALKSEHLKVGSATRQRDRALAVLERARAKLKADGGDLFAARDTLLSARARLDGRLDEARKALRSWASEAAPLLLVPALLRQVAEQGEREAVAEANHTILAHLSGRDERTLLELQRLGADEALILRARAFFDTDRNSLSRAAEGARLLELPGVARAGLHGLLEEGFGASRAERDQLLRRLDEFEAGRDDLERQIASIPAAEAVAPLLRAVDEGERALAQVEVDLTVCKRDHEAAERALSAARSRLQAKLDRQVQQRLTQEDAHRMVEHAARVRETLRLFRGEVIRHHIGRLERLILGALRELVRKADLIVDVKIDPETFAITLRGGGWDVLSPDELSAGERQLFAVALLWGLAKASGQAAPTVIDTPLGRLDSQHRARLVDRYFPQAGSQVVLLSTDEEIDARLYERLAPSICRSFTIVYDAEGRGSHVEPGYAFASKAALEAA